MEILQLIFNLDLILEVSFIIDSHLIFFRRKEYEYDNIHCFVEVTPLGTRPNIFIHSRQ